MSREQCHLIHLTIPIEGSPDPIYPVCAQKLHKALISSFVSTAEADILASTLPSTIGLPAVVADIYSIRVTLPWFGCPPDCLLFFYLLVFL